MDKVSISDGKSDVKVSIIMPVYNAEKYIKDTLRSVMSQTFQEFELICINDGSTDGTAEILDQYASIYKNIRVLHIKNSGPAYARNVGISEAVGQWIQFVDADDKLECCMLEKMYKASLSNCWDMIVCGFYRDVAQSNSCDICSIVSCELTTRKELQDFFLGMNIKTKSILMNYLWNRWFKRSVLVDGNISFDSSLRLGEDFVFISQVLKKMNSVLVIEEPLYHYCIRDIDSLSRQFDQNEAYRRKVMYKAFCDCMESYGILEQMKSFIDYNEGSYAVNAISKINNRTCNLSRKEKENYVKSLTTKKLKDCELTYLRNQGWGGGNHL